MPATIHLASALVQIAFESKPSTGAATLGREFFRSAFTPLLGDDDLCFSVALVAHELMENIIKYSQDGERSISVGIDSAEGERRVWIRSVNRVAESELDSLTSALDLLRTTDTPEALYDRMISASANRDGSGLGLIRIRAEANMRIDYEVLGNLVTILASRGIALPTEAQTVT